MTAKTGLTQTITRTALDIDNKLVAGIGSSITVGAVVSQAHSMFGVNLPVWAGYAIVIVAYFVGGYVTKSKIPNLTMVPADSSSSAAGKMEQAAETVGANVAEGKPADFERLFTAPAETPTPTA